MANIELLAEIAASGMYILIIVQKYSLNKQFVYAGIKNGGLRFLVSRRNRSVDQLGLEPRTSRL